MIIGCLEAEKKIRQHYLRLYSVFLFFVIFLAIISVSNLIIAVAPVGGPCHLTEGCCSSTRTPEPPASGQDSGIGSQA